jgi:hypothetical protein
MKLPGRILLLCTIVFSISFTSCRKDQVQAERSIEGSWEVVSITSIYAEFSANGYNPDSTFSDTGNLGTFDFADETVNYSFTRHGNLYSGSGNWDISAERVNSGFTKVTRFTLDIGNDFLFEAVFEDATKNSEKNATEVSLTETPTSGYGVLIQMILEKR